MAKNYLGLQRQAYNQQVRVVILPLCSELWFSSENLEPILGSLLKHRLTYKRQWIWVAVVESQTIRKIFHTEAAKYWNVLAGEAGGSQSAEMFLSQLDNALSNMI